MKKFKCPFCDEISTELTGIHAHLERRHADNLPKGTSVEESYYNLRTGKTHGNCVVCKRETQWNPATNKYHRFCGRAVCKEKYVNEFKKRMIGVHGKTTLLNDPEQQRKMLANRSISGEYTWSDGKKKPYTGSYEKDFLQFLDLFMEFDSEDIFAPSPHTYYYEYEGDKHFYIPDFFIASLNLEVEIKDGGDNPNNHHKIQAVDKVKEAKKDKVLENQKEFSYIKLVNKEYMPFVDYLLKRKEDFKEKAEGMSAEDVLDNKVVMESTLMDSPENMVWTVCPNPLNQVYRGCSDIAHQYEGRNPHEVRSTEEYCNPHGIILEPIHKALYQVLNCILAYSPANLEADKLERVLYDMVERMEGRDECDIVLHDHYAVAAILNKVLAYTQPDRAVQYQRMYEMIIDRSVKSCKRRTSELNLEPSKYEKQLEEFYDLNVRRNAVGGHLYVYSTKRLEKPQVSKGDKMVRCDLFEVLSLDDSILDGSKVYTYRPVRPISYTSGDSDTDERFVYSDESCELELDSIFKVRRNVKDEHTETYEVSETDARFDKVYEATTMDVERTRPVYVLLSHSGTVLSNAIQKVTKEPYSHASISLDPQLKNMYSFGRKYKSNPLIGTFVRENIQAGLYEDVAHKTKYSLYVTFVSDEEYERIERCLNEFLEPGKKFKYNFIGLLRYTAGLKTEREDAFFCSEFVASVLQSANPERYFTDTHRSMVKPYDIAKSDNMAFVTRGMLNYYDPNKVSAITARVQKQFQ